MKFQTGRVGRLRFPFLKPDGVCSSAVIAQRNFVIWQRDVHTNTLDLLAYAERSNNAELPVLFTFFIEPLPR